MTVRRVLSFTAPIVLSVGAIATLVSAQEAGSPCEDLVAGTGLGTAVQPTAEEAVIIVFPQLEGQLSSPDPSASVSPSNSAQAPPSPSSSGDTEFTFPDGSFVDVTQQSNGNYVLCSENLQ